MADFCKACSKDMWGIDLRELAGLSTEEDTKKNLYPVVICESCGPIQVDHNGVCVTTDCKVCKEDSVLVCEFCSGEWDEDTGICLECKEHAAGVPGPITN